MYNSNCRRSDLLCIEFYIMVTNNSFYTRNIIDSNSIKF